VSGYSTRAVENVFKQGHGKRANAALACFSAWRSASSKLSAETAFRLLEGGSFDWICMNGAGFAGPWNRKKGIRKCTGRVYYLIRFRRSRAACSEPSGSCMLIDPLRFAHTLRVSAVVMMILVFPLGDFAISIIMNTSSLESARKAVLSRITDHPSLIMFSR
jgi:hypothetical protein